MLIWSNIPIDSKPQPSKTNALLRKKEIKATNSWLSDLSKRDAFIKQLRFECPTKVHYANSSYRIEAFELLPDIDIDLIMPDERLILHFQCKSVSTITYNPKLDWDNILLISDPNNLVILELCEALFIAAAEIAVSRSTIFN